MLLMASVASPALAGPLREWLAHRSLAEDAFAEEAASADMALPQGCKILKDVAYGSDPLQRMDVYLPSHAANAPVIVMVHGGGWRRGDKAASTVVENKVKRWVPMGFIFVSVNYRLLPQADLLTQADDVARALAAVQAKAAAWGGDAGKIVLMGHSAGAHLVALLTSSPNKAYALGVKPWLGTVVLDSAALNAVQVMQARHYRLYDEAFGRDVEYWKAVSPFYAVSEQARPMLLVCSSIRPDAPCTQAQNYAGKARALGLRVELSEQALSHKEVNQNLGLAGGYTEAVEHFMGSLDPSVAHVLTH